MPYIESATDEKLNLFVKECCIADVQSVGCKKIEYIIKIQSTEFTYF
jgi:hypothetical protein